ncbi:MAG: sulfurtransferase TusA family protein [Deltaproteobacteria bacterium]|nr:sulfurtransferase TusA family protein [Deltaproteobacteria bacterium]
MEQKADYRLDLRGAITPITLLKATEVFRQMKCNQVLEVVGRDSDTRNDLLKVLPPLSFDLISSEEIAEDMSYRIQLKKRR